MRHMFGAHYPKYEVAQSTRLQLVASALTKL